MYIFPFWLYPKELSKEEELIKMIDAKIQKQAQAEGGTEIELPEKINGKRLYWEKEGDSYFLKFLIFEGVVGVGLILTEKEKEKNCQQNFNFKPGGNVVKNGLGQDILVL